MVGFDLSWFADGRPSESFAYIVGCTGDVTLDGFLSLSEVHPVLVVNRDRDAGARLTAEATTLCPVVVYRTGPVSGNRTPPRWRKVVSTVNHRRPRVRRGRGRPPLKSTAPVFLAGSAQHEADDMADDWADQWRSMAARYCGDLNGRSARGGRRHIGLGCQGAGLQFGENRRGPGGNSPSAAPEASRAGNVAMTVLVCANRCGPHRRGCRRGGRE